jgi:hypothetical protein
MAPFLLDLLYHGITYTVCLLWANTYCTNNSNLITKQNEHVDIIPLSLIEPNWTNPIGFKNFPLSPLNVNQQQQKQQQQQKIGCCATAKVCQSSKMAIKSTLVFVLLIFKYFAQGKGICKIFINWDVFHYRRFLYRILRKTFKIRMAWLYSQSKKGSKLLDCACLSNQIIGK